jgi:hypothetical protein
MPRENGCVTNFDHEGQKLTIWKSGKVFHLQKPGEGEALPLTYDPLFQSIAAEVHRLAVWVGQLRAREIDLMRELRTYKPDPEPAEPGRKG